jgi:hypothetical protein
MVAMGCKISRVIWTGTLVLFAVRAVAGIAVCELQSGRATTPLGSVQAVTVSDHPAHQRQGAAPHEHPPSGETPTHDQVHHACAGPVFLTGEVISISAINGLLVKDAVAQACPQFNVRPSAAVAGNPPLQHRAHPRPPYDQLDVSPRLRL